MWNRLRTVNNSVKYAWKGIRYAWTHERNFRFQMVAAAVVIALMIVLQVRPLEAVALIFVIVAVLVLELMNTIIERFIDILKPRMHHYAEMIKDMMAAAVLLAALGAIAVGVIIFYPYIFGITS